MNKFILSFSLILGLTTVTANAAMIDGFDEESMFATISAPSPVIMETAGNASSNSSTAISTFGGSRSINISKYGYLGANAAVIAPPGIFTHSSDALTTATSTISWHSDTGIDLIEGRTTTNFALDILAIDQGDIDLVLSVTDFLNNSDSFTLTGAGTGINFIALTLFTGIDFLQITDISLEIVGDVASDLTLNSISTVPTPSILVLLSLGLVAFGFNRRITI